MFICSFLYEALILSSIKYIHEHIDIHGMSGHAWQQRTGYCSGQAGVLALVEAFLHHKSKNDIEKLTFSKVQQGLTRIQILYI